MMDAATYSSPPPDSRALAVERCEAVLSREFGPLTLYQHIALHAALEELAADVAQATRHCDPWC